MKKKKEKITRLVIPQSKSSDTLFDFVSYCVEHPYERFWQALRNWANVNFILFSKKNPNETTVNDLIDTFYIDTFYFEGKDK